MTRWHFCQGRIKPEQSAEGTTLRRAARSVGSRPGEPPEEVALVPRWACRDWRFVGPTGKCAVEVLYCLAVDATPARPTEGTGGRLAVACLTGDAHLPNGGMDAPARDGGARRGVVRVRPTAAGRSIRERGASAGWRDDGSRRWRRPAARDRSVPRAGDRRFL